MRVQSVPPTGCAVRARLNVTFPARVAAPLNVIVLEETAPTWRLSVEVLLSVKAPAVIVPEPLKPSDAPPDTDTVVAVLDAPPMEPLTTSAPALTFVLPE